MTAPVRDRNANSHDNDDASQATTHRRIRSASVFRPRSLLQALPTALRHLDPRVMVKTPVMFVVLVGAALCTVLCFTDPSTFVVLATIWLWLTVVFANVADAVAEGRGKAQAASLRDSRDTLTARRLDAAGIESVCAAADLTVGDLVACEAGDVVPGDGDIVEGVASVDESAITGESAPVVRESGGDRSSVTGGTRVLSDRVVVKITAEPGQSFVDRMIALVEGSQRQKTPNEIALNILLASLTIVFLLVVMALQPMAAFSGSSQSIVVLVCLLVCLIPTTIGALVSCIGVAGMDRLVQRNVLAMSGRAVEAAGDVSTLLLDKTGTITFGNRQAAALFAAPEVSADDLRDAALISSLADDTPEGKSIVDLCVHDGADLAKAKEIAAAGEVVEFSARTRMSGLDISGLRASRDAQSAPRPSARASLQAVDAPSLSVRAGVTHGDRQIRKGAVTAVAAWLAEQGVDGPAETLATADEISSAGGTPLLVATNSRALGVVHLKDVVKPTIAERFSDLRAMGIRTVMITGDSELTARSIAAEAGLDDYLAEATPEDKMAYIKREQQDGRIVAMTGDGTNDAPALAQADVGVAMNTGTAAAKEAGNMVDLDSSPTKLIDIVEIGKQLLITRGRSHHLLVGQRRGQVLRDSAGDVRRRLSGPGEAEHHAPVQPAVGDPVGRHLQRSRHRRVDPVGHARCQLPAGVGRRAAGQEPGDLWPRWHHRAVRRHQTHRPAHPSHSRNRLIPMASDVTNDAHSSGAAMLKTAGRQTLISLRVLLAMTVIVGVLYPALVFGIGRLMLARADGSMLTGSNGQPVGSALIGQQFAGRRWFQGRPSASDNDAMASGGSNLAADSDRLATEIAQRRAQIAAADGVSLDQVPADAVTASASGLDPDISPAYARLQVARVATAGGLDREAVQQLVERQVTGRSWGFFGEPRVNVLQLNLALRALKP